VDWASSRLSLAASSLLLLNNWRRSPESSNSWPLSGTVTAQFGGAAGSLPIGSLRLRAPSFPPPTSCFSFSPVSLVHSGRKSSFHSRGSGGSILGRDASRHPTSAPCSIDCCTIKAGPLPQDSVFSSFILSTLHLPFLLPCTDRTHSANSTPLTYLHTSQSRQPINHVIYQHFILCRCVLVAAPFPRRRLLCAGVSLRSVPLTLSHQHPVRVILKARDTASAPMPPLPPVLAHTSWVILIPNVAPHC
jgi:hypothetical protein